MEVGDTSYCAVHVHSLVYPLELQWCLLLSVSFNFRSVTAFIPLAQGRLHLN